MSTHVRSYSKVNLGLAIGPVREDGFHELTTVYQTLALYDMVTVQAHRSTRGTKISINTNHPFVPKDRRNTVWKMVERALERFEISAEVAITIEKKLPLQGGMGAGSANAAATLLGLERELGLELKQKQRLEVAAEVGSDVPLFLIGGSVLGLGRGEKVHALPELGRLRCVVAVPRIGVSTPQAFRDWDTLAHGEGNRGTDLTFPPAFSSLEKLSYAHASSSMADVEPGTSGIFRDSGMKHPEKQRDGLHMRGESLGDLAENTLLELVRTGIENDFERVVFHQYPFLRDIKLQLMGDPDGVSGESALYAALSGSGSAVFGLYESEAAAELAQRRVQAIGVETLLTETLPREAYWTRMFAG